MGISKGRTFLLPSGLKAQELTVYDAMLLTYVHATCYSAYPNRPRNPFAVVYRRTLNEMLDLLMECRLLDSWLDTPWKDDPQVMYGTPAEYAKTIDTTTKTAEALLDVWNNVQVFYIR